MNKKLIWGVVIAVVVIVVGVYALKTVAFVTCYSDWEQDNCYVDTFPYFGKSIVEQYATTTPGYFKKINTVSTSDWKTYINNEFGFQFNYPQFSKITEESLDLKKSTKQINISLNDPIKKGYVAKVIMKVNYFPVFECNQNAPKQTINGNIFNVVKGRQQGSDMIGKNIYYIIHNNYCYEIHSSTIEGPTAASQTDFAEIDNYLESVLSTFKFTSTATTTPQSSIKVISPNGGEVWKMGEKKEISWRSANFPEPTSGNGVSAPSDVVTIFINTESVDSPPLYKFIDEVPRTKNSYLWTVGSVRNDSLLPGTYYIKVCRQGSFCDWSDTQLTITN